MKETNALVNPQLIAFMAVVKYKTVHAAAKVVHLSQTAVTQRIRNLEKSINTTLFIRTRQGMTLTAEGEKLLRYCQAVFDYSNETLFDINEAGIESVQRVQISGPSSLMISRIIPHCVSIMKRFPHLYISFDVNDNDAVKYLREGKSQFSILIPEQVSSDMASKPLAPEKYHLVCSHQWKGRKLTDILNSERIIDFDEADQMTFSYLKQFNLQAARQDRLFVNRTESLATMLLEGYGYGVLTKEFSEPFLKNKTLIALNAGKTYDNPLVLCWYARPKPPSYFATILQAIQ